MRAETSPSRAGPSPRVRRAARRLAVLSVSAAAAVLVVEVGYRIQLYGISGLSPAQVRSLRPVGTSGMLRSSASPRILFELKPDLRTRFKLVPFQTNSRGMRDREYALEKPAGTFRVAAVGDSFTMGEGVLAEDVFHSVLERDAAAGGDGPPIECLNFGVAGYELENEIGVLEEKVPPWDPDLVLLALNLTDVKVPPPRGSTGTRDFAQRGDPFWELSWVDLPRGLWNRTAIRRAARETRAAGRAEPGPRDDSVREYLDRSLGQVAEWSRATGVPVLVLFLSTSDHPTYREAANRVAMSCARNGLPVLDTCPLFAGLDRREYVILPNDNHPNRAAHAMYARAIERWLRTDGPLAR